VPFFEFEVLALTDDHADFVFSRHVVPAPEQAHIGRGNGLLLSQLCHVKNGVPLAWVIVKRMGWCDA